MGIRNTIIASVIASLVVLVFIQPLLKTSWAFLLWAGPIVAEGVTNRIYENAAQGNRNWVVSTVTLMGLEALSLGLLVTISGITIKAVQLKRKAQAFRNALVNPEPTDSPTTPEDYLDTLDSITWKKIWYGLISLFITIPVVIIFSFWLGMQIFTDIQLNTSFQQRLKVLAPVVTDLEHKQFEASWALMENRSDYLRLVAQMEKKAKDASITLPKLLDGAK